MPAARPLPLLRDTKFSVSLFFSFLKLILPIIQSLAISNETSPSESGVSIREEILSHLKSGVKGNIPNTDIDPSKGLRKSLKVSQEVTQLPLCVWGASASADGENSVSEGAVPMLVSPGALLCICVEMLLITNRGCEFGLINCLFSGSTSIKIQAFLLGETFSDCRLWSCEKTG